MITSYSTYSVNVPLYSETFADNSWADIQAAVKAGLASSYWEVGDSKAVTLNGGVGNLTFNNETYYVFILGFNHNATYEGNNTIHMSFAKTADGKDIAFCDGQYNTGGSSAGFRMNTNNTNSGGWSGSYMRNNICSAFFNLLPTDLKNVIADCTKYTNNTGNNNDPSAVTATQDKVWLLAEFEVFGTRSYANNYEQNYQNQYDYYKNGNSKVRYKHNGTSTACFWWLRSAYCSISYAFCIVWTGGAATGDGARYSYGFAPGFKIS